MDFTDYTDYSLILKFVINKQQIARIARIFL